MRVVLVLSRFPVPSETFIANKFLGLLDRGLDVHVVCDHWDREAWASFPELAARPALRARVHPTWPHRPRWVAAALVPAAAARAALSNPRAVGRYAGNSSLGNVSERARAFYIDAAIVALKPDIVHFEFGALAVGRMRLKETLGCRVIASFRGFDLNYHGLDRADYYEDVWARSDAVHVLGEDLWRRARSRGCPPDKLHVAIAPAIDATIFDVSDPRPADLCGTANRPLRIVSVGRLEWKKGYEYALQAVALLRDRGVHCAYQIVGEGPYREAIAFARHRLELEEVVALSGRLPRSGVVEAMTSADVFLHAAVSEGFCNAVLEAQAMRLPVVTSDADGLAENVVDGVTGFVVPRRDSTLLADRLDHLSRDGERRRNMGNEGRRRVVADFGLAAQLAAFEDLYVNVVTGKERST